MAYSGFVSNNYVSQDELVTGHLDLVKRIANHLSARLPSTIDMNDLLQAGMIGLLEASGNFDATKGASFDTFAGIRIRGAMLDEVRRLDWTPRSVHKKHREASEVMRRIEAETGRAADAQEVADGLGIAIDEYHKIVRDTAFCRLFSLEEAIEEHGNSGIVPCAETATPEQALAQEQFRTRLANGVRRLPEREQLVLSLYYEREMNLKEIGVVLGVSESRVCQIHGQALLRLRSMTLD